MLVREISEQRSCNGKQFNIYIYLRLIFFLASEMESNYSEFKGILFVSHGIIEHKKSLEHNISFLESKKNIHKSHYRAVFHKSWQTSTH